MFANPVRPRTMTKEWQEATEEYLKVRILLFGCWYCDTTDTLQAQGSEPITGYKGMMIQSKSEKDVPTNQKINDE